MKTRNLNSWTTRASGLETGPWPLSSLKKEFSKEKAVKQLKPLFGKKEKYVWKDAGVGVTSFGGWLQLFVWGQFSGFPLANHLASSCFMSISACNAGHLGSIPRLRRYPGEENGCPLHLLAWRIPWTEGKGGRHNRATNTWSDSEPSQCGHTSSSQDGFQHKSVWEVMD